MEKPEEFKAKMVDGKLQIQCRTEEIPNANGGVDVIVHAPALSVISAFNKKYAPLGLCKDGAENSNNR